MKLEPEEKLSFIAGSFQISASNKESIKSKAILYFQDDNKEWITKELSSNLKATDFDDESISELLELKTVEFDILHPQPKRSIIDEIFQDFSKKIDQKILNLESRKDLLFIEGQYEISTLNKESIKSEAILYFQDDNKEWITKELSSNLKATDFDDESISELLELKTVEFDILHPNA